MEFLLKTFGDPIYSDIETLHVMSPYTSDSISDEIARSDTPASHPACSLPSKTHPSSKVAPTAVPTRAV